MGMGMLFAGALTGGAKAVNELVDQSYKREDDERKRNISIMDRRNELLFEMKAKSDMARREEEAAAGAFNRVAQRGEEIGNERGARELESARSTALNEGEFANERVTPDMLASMPPAARSIYEQQMGLTDDSELQGLRDQVQASGEVAAPASVRKAVTDNYREGRKADKDAREMERREKEDARRADTDERRLDQGERRMEQQFTLGQQRLDAYERRGGGAGGGSAAKVRSTKTNADGEVMAIMSDGTIKPLGIQDQAFGKAVAAAVAKMDGDRQYRKLSEAEKISLAKSRLAGGAVGAEVDELPPAAPAAVPASPARSASSGGGAAGDIAANERSIALLKKQPLNRSEAQSSRDEQIRMIELENARMRGVAAPVAAKANPAVSGYRAGEQRVVAEGPNKGKTAVYDGTGWKLK